jgi:hypothetical protein
MAQRLDPKILDHLVDRLDLQKRGVQTRISEIRAKQPSLTLNAAASIFARQRGTSVSRWLDEQDRLSLGGIGSSQQVVIVKSITTKNKSVSRRLAPKTLVTYYTTDSFEQRHIEEINLAYNAGCYTAAYVLCRKVIENLIIGILKRKYPPKNPKNLNLYYDRNAGRFKDFSEILKNLYDKRSQFLTATGQVHRLYSLSKAFAKDANNKTHSLFHIATKPELEQSRIQEILDLVGTIHKELDTQKL